MLVADSFFKSLQVCHVFVCEGVLFSTPTKVRPAGVEEQVECVMTLIIARAVCMETMQWGPMSPREGLRVVQLYLVWLPCSCPWAAATERLHGGVGESQATAL